MGRRVNGNIGFYRNWATYRNGFGDLLGNFWLGNQALYRLTNANNYELRMDVKFNGQNFYAKFSSFRVENESQKFRLRLGTYSGTVGDTAGFGMNYSNNRAFSTHDRDNDGTDRLSCAVNGKSAWWYDRCTKVDLNGEYDKKTPPKGIRWNNGVANRYATFTEMKIRRV
ncbi:hypothetical protein RRG08_014829 [Elysia crispata]|uniref:Fibrinogen C-terminal domain-containing protein n=1 Tax=Elysia crispata TaxID=231223 RepID=A0AAE0Z699_9GAST|nr:hypothetical protein RRG08_014829 [Elysia crispata]